MEHVVKNEPIWAKNPKTGKEVNVEPLFRLMNENLFGWCNSPKDLESRIDDVITYIGRDTVSAQWNNTEMDLDMFHKISMRQVCIFESLNELKDMFCLMKERE